MNHTAAAVQALKQIGFTMPAFGNPLKNEFDELTNPEDFGFEVEHRGGGAAYVLEVGDFTMVLTDQTGSKLPDDDWASCLIGVDAHRACAEDNGVVVTGWEWAQIVTSGALDQA